MKSSSQLAGWERFVLDHGWRAHAYELAVVVGQSIEEIERIRRTGACTKLSSGKEFGALFALWHGRAPTDDEWPKPRKFGAGRTYEWQAPELALLASLVGQVGPLEIAQVLTNRLRERTGDPLTVRSRNAIQIRTNLIGLQTSDVVGGITTAEAGREIDSQSTVHQAIRKKDLIARRVGKLWVIPHDTWAAWKAKRVFPPKGYVQLSTIREALSIRSDKLSEYARMGLIPTAVRCNPYGTKAASTKFGTWWIDGAVAKKLLADRRVGLPMPWYGKYLDNLRTTFKLFQQRQHPASCKTCAEIWGKKGAPASFDDYAARYPGLAHGAKRHLTRQWTPGLTISEVATLAGCSTHYVRYAIRNGMLNTTLLGRTQYVSRTDATRWRARKCPTGAGTKSWISLLTAREQYMFTLAELRRFISSKQLTSKIGTDGTMRGIEYVSRHQCGQLREKIGVTEEDAARRVGVTVPRLRRLLEGVDWRKAKGIPLMTVQAVIKRLESHEGYSIEEAAEKLGTNVQWVLDRKQDGTIKVSKAPWDRRRVYITEAMFERLRTARQKPVNRERFSADWLRQSDAAREAGVSAATVIKWADEAELDRRHSSTGWRYHREAVRARARIYWQSVRFHRAAPPDWLRAEFTQPRVGRRSTKPFGRSPAIMSM